MRIIFPFDPLEKNTADGPFRDEYELLKSMGIDCSLFDYDSLEFDELKPKPQVIDGDCVLYRGWMLTPSLYGKLASMVERKGGSMFTSPSSFVSSHHLPEWYESCVDFTPETVFSNAEEDLEKLASDLGWDSFFVKDYVKSNYNERGSIAKSPREVLEIVALIKEHRGEIEGGISLRKVEEYLPETEKRYFVVNGKAYSPDGVVPELVLDVSKAHHAPFYSIDVIQRSDGVLRLVELGDGQVSDKKTWSAGVFCKMIAENT
ncbi:ATP-grasp domain-containing protein [Zooshikella ganghwensis]|uniref:ATP-grasp domain-containing protein n=1 Tax=Zooshikella ganghwensis TaxID=202772 RepID=UPI0003F94B05|nr:ATP-grasp domain-containing protein [Zooshikella ganghwensis]